MMDRQVDQHVMDDVAPLKKKCFVPLLLCEGSPR